jgi:hypothetical protein
LPLNVLFCTTTDPSWLRIVPPRLSPPGDLALSRLKLSPSLPELDGHLSFGKGTRQR